MVKLIKTQEPAVLTDKESEWIQHVMVFYFANQKIPDSVIDKYRNDDVKSALIEETSEKCAYCESKITNIDYGDIEHIVPKSKYPWLAFSWDNLTLACAICNNKKGTYFEYPSLFLNPYKDNLLEHIIAIGPLIMHVTGSAKGLFTRKKINLNRKPLRESRMDAIESFQSVLDQFHKESNPSLKDIYKDELEEMMLPEKEYSFTLKCYAIARNFIQTFE